VLTAAIAKDEGGRMKDESRRGGASSPFILPASSFILSAFVPLTPTLSAEYRGEVEGARPHF
jgi:hypothetical protein